MFNSMGSSNPQDLGNGGEISGDLTVTGSLNVGGSIGLTLSEVIQGTSTIDVDSTTALVVRKNGAAGDVFVVDTTNGDVTVQNSGNTFLNITSTGGGARMKLTGQADETTNGILFYETTNVRGQINYNHADQKMEFKTGDSNTLALTIDSSQRFGIGDASPDYKLDVETTANSDVTVANFQSAIDANGEHSIIRVGHGSKAAYMGLLLNSADTAYFGIDDNPDDGNGIYVNESGNVGIGTNSPSQMLHIASSTDAFIQLERVDTSVADNDAIGAILFRGGESSIADIGRIRLHADADFTSSSSPTKMVFETTPSGTTVDSVALTLDSSQNATFAGDVTISGGDMTLTGATTSIIGEQSAGANRGKIKFITSGSDGDIAFETTTNGAGAIAEAMRIDHNGNVGIGVSSLETQNDQYVALQLGGNANIISKITDQASNPLNILNNAYSATDTNWKKIREDQSSRYSQLDGSHTFFVNNVTGSADDNITWATALTIDADANATFAGKVKIDQNATDAFSLHIDSEATTTHNLYFESPVTTTGAVIRIDGAGGLTTGHLFNANISSTSMATTATDGAFKIDHTANTGSNVNNLMYLHNNHASSTGTIPLKIQQDSTGPAAHFITSENQGDGLIIEMSGTASGGSYITFQYDENASAPSETGDLHGGIRFRSAYSNDTYSGYGASITSSSEGGPPSSSQSPGNLVFSTTPTSSTTLVERMRISNGGNVGIGTDSPEQLLHLKSEAPFMAFTDTSNNSETGVLYRNTSGTNVGFSIYDFNSNELKFRANSSLKFIIDSNSVISLSNNDSGVSNTIFGKDAGDSDGAGDYNVFVGEKSGGTGTQTDDADYNVGIGYWALTDLTQGESNVAVGAFALENNTTGVGNVAIGSWDSSTYQAPLTTNQTGSFNIAIGSGVLRLANEDDNDGSVGIGYGALNNQAGTGGSQFANATTAVGYKALEAMTTATGNTAMGYSSMTTNQNSNNNTAVGYYTLGNVNGGNGANTAVGNLAMLSNTTGATNTAVGDNASRLNQTGVDNVSVGRSALYNNTTDRNTAIGLEAGYTTTGADNTYVGYRSGYGASGAEANNVGVGQNSLLSVTTGSDNVAVGQGSADALTTGDKNIAIGRLALSSSQDADNCIAIGYAAMNANNDANSDGSIAIGYAAMNNLTTGAGNVGLGFEVMKQATTGKHNTSVGHQSMYNAMNVGDSNTAMGYQSLYSLDPDTDDHGSNTAVGKQSGYDVSTGTGNVLVGANAGNSGSNDLTTGDNNTYIGNEAAGASASNSNSTVIGATAIGSGSNTVTLGNASVTDVYMAQDSGATVHCANIQFPSSQAADSGANVLDDYEEGEHTTAITGATSGSWTMDSAQTKLAYTKIGRMVTVVGKFETDSGSGSGTLKISLPFTSADLTAGAGITAGSITINRYGSTSIASQITPIVFEGTNYINIQKHNTDGTSNEGYIQADDIDGIFEGQLSITYFTD